MIIALIGGPGSGKGAQIKLLIERFPLTHISTGDILRMSATEGTQLEASIGDCLTNGYLVSDEVVIPLVENQLISALSRGAARYIILDGFPRTLIQAKYLDNFLRKKNFELNVVIYLKLDFDTLYKRNIGRRLCLNCEKDYNMFFESPKIDELCDLCGNNLIQRHDSSIEAINHRIFEYKTKTIPMIGFYEKKELLFVVDGGKNKKEIHERILKRIRGKNMKSSGNDV